MLISAVMVLGPCSSVEAVWSRGKQQAETHIHTDTRIFPLVIEILQSYQAQKVAITQPSLLFWGSENRNSGVKSGEKAQALIDDVTRRYSIHLVITHLRNSAVRKCCSQVTTAHVQVESQVLNVQVQVNKEKI